MSGHTHNHPSTTFFQTYNLCIVHFGLIGMKVGRLKGREIESAAKVPVSYELRRTFFKKLKK